MNIIFCRIALVVAAANVASFVWGAVTGDLMRMSASVIGAATCVYLARRYANT